MISINNLGLRIFFRSGWGSNLGSWWCGFENRFQGAYALQYHSPKAQFSIWPLNSLGNIFLQLQCEIKKCNCEHWPLPERQSHLSDRRQCIWYKFHNNLGWSDYKVWPFKINDEFGKEERSSHYYDWSNRLVFCQSSRFPLLAQWRSITEQVVHGKLAPLISPIPHARISKKNYLDFSRIRDWFNSSP